MSIEFFVWWYHDLAVALFANLSYYFRYLTDLFSVSICLRTLFSVWKRDRISYDGLSLQEMMSAWVLNLVSRFIGFVIKTTVLIIFLIALIIYLVVAVLLIICWFTFPLLIIASLVYGLKLILHL
ncbi:MAG: hypothetical protein NTW50_04280 [Candidatus Berkelbacteria bacterium]|nr:hypothetical protein [Candidatus Berkelbacteria bacterium]